MRKVAFLLIVLSATNILVANSAQAWRLLKYAGANHNGAKLYYRLEDIGNRGRAVRLHFKLECAKNHGGEARGYAHVEIFSFISDDLNRSTSLQCHISGSGWPNESRIRHGHSLSSVTMRISPRTLKDDFELIGAVRATSVSNTDVLRRNFEREFNRAIAGVQRELRGALGSAGDIVEETIESVVAGVAGGFRAEP